MISFLFIRLKHPLTIIIRVILITIISRWTITQTFSNSWLRIILILIWLGGLLIIFIYLSSIVPNELFFTNPNRTLIFLFYFCLNPFLINFSIINLKHMEFYAVSNNNLIIILILLYIIITLFISIYITSFIKRPLKQDID